MKILLLTNCIAQPDDKGSDVNDLVFSFAIEWKKAGHEVVIIDNESKFPLFFYKMPKPIVNFFKRRGNFTVPSLSSRKPKIWKREGIMIARFPLFKPFPHCSFRKSQYIKQSYLIADFLEKMNFIPDVITGHWLEPQLVLVENLGNRYNSKKAVVIHGELPERLSNHYKSIISSLDVVFFRSSYVKKKMLKTYGDDYLKQSSVKICYSGVPDKFVFEQKRRTDWNDNLKFIFVGRLERYKRVDVVLRSLKESFPNKNFSFEIVGNGPEHDGLAALVKKLGLEDNVSFSGRVSRDEVIKRMRTADCFVMPSENEVFGLVYLEAMSCGCLTIASKNGGIDGIIENGKNGFLCEQGNANDLSKIFNNLNTLTFAEKDAIRNCAYDTVKLYTDSRVAKAYIDSITESDKK